MTKQKEALLQYLDGGMTTIIMHTFSPKTVLPQHLLNKIKITLNLSYRFDTDIFEITDQHVKIKLTFSNKKHLCVLPLESIYFIFHPEAFMDGTGFQESFPIKYLESMCNFQASASSEYIVEDEDD